MCFALAIACCVVGVLCVAAVLVKAREDFEASEKL